MKTREDALKLMQEWVQLENLRKHMLCVEAAVWQKKTTKNI